MYSHSINSRSCEIKNILVGIISSAMLLVQGCASDPVYRGISPQQAEEYVARIAGTAKPSNITLGEFYQQDEKYVFQDGRTWICGDKPTRVVLTNLVLKAGSENSVKGSMTSYGDWWTSNHCTTAGCDCVSYGESAVAGRYDGNFLYLYFPMESSTYISKYQINNKDSYNKNRLVLLGQLKYIDDVWMLHTAYSTFEVIEKNDYMATEIYQRNDFRLMDGDPRLTAIERQEELTRSANNEAYKSSDYAARQRAEINAAAREANASVGTYIQQKGAENAAILSDLNRQTVAAYAETNRRLAEQAAERTRAREEREDDERRRDEDRAREAELRRQRETDSQQAAKQEGAGEQVPKCEYYLNENAFPPGLTPEKRDAARRAAEESNARLRDRGIPPCEVNKPTGPSRNSSK